MWKRSTQLKIVFFGLLLVGFVVIQYKWVQSLQKDKMEVFRQRVLDGIENAMQGTLSRSSLYKMKDTAIAGSLRRSFLAKGLGSIPFEFSIGNREPVNSSHLLFQYVSPFGGKSYSADSSLTVVIPFWKKHALQGMNWIIASSVLLTILLLVIFCSAFLLGDPNQELFYDRRTLLIRKMMQQLEVPLSTVSVAAEALRNARVANDSGKINYYQQVINEENKRMNEQVERFLRELSDAGNTKQ